MKLKSFLITFLLFLTIIGITSYSEVEATTHGDCDASEDLICVETSKEFYKKGDIIHVFGKVSKVIPNQQVSLIVVSPSGENVSIGQVNVEGNKTFNARFFSSSSLWYLLGTYTINVKYGSESISKQIEIMPAENTEKSDGCQLDSINHPKIILDKIPFEVDAGQTIIFTGRLVCENGYKHSNALIMIIEDDIIEQEVLATGYTDNNGEFSITWKAKAQMIEETLTIRAKYTTEPNEVGSYYAPESDKRFLTVHRLVKASISLDPLPQSAEIGQTLFFTGTLDLQSANPEGHVVYIKDEDPLSSDDLLATAYVSSDGKFSANWIVTNVDDDKVADIYAVFEGADIYWRVTTCDIGITRPLGGGCDRTIPLKITGEIPPPPPPKADDSDGDGIPDSKDVCPSSPENFNGYLDNDGCPDSTPEPSLKEQLNGNEYINLYYSHGFEKNPLVAIVPDPDSYDKTRSYMIPSQEGIRTWEYQLTKKFGGNWQVDFEFITPNSKFEKKPDIIVNLVTRDDVSGCGVDFGGLAYISYPPQKPTNTIVCTSTGNYFYSSSSVSGISAHEFIHAMGLGHTFNKIGDLMCSVENGQPTCGNQFYASKSSQPSDFNLAAVRSIYGEDGFLNPNNNPDYRSKFTATNYRNDEFLDSSSKQPINTENVRPSDLERKAVLPNWIKNNAEWWANGVITDFEFMNGVKYMIKERVIIISEPSSTVKSSSNTIPEWIKSNAKWWSENKLSDNEFTKSIEYLVNNGIIQLD